MPSRGGEWSRMRVRSIDLDSFSAFFDWNLEMFCQCGIFF